MNVEIDKEGWILSAAFNCDSAVPMPPDIKIDAGIIMMPASNKFHGNAKGVYAASAMQSVWVYVDGRSARYDENAANDQGAVVRGWVKLSSSESID